MKKFRTYSDTENRSRKINHKAMKQNRKLSTEQKEVRNDTSYLESILFAKKSTAR